MTATIGYPSAYGYTISLILLQSHGYSMDQDRTTIEISPSIRDRLRKFKDDRGQTYDGALETLLAARGYSGDGSVLSKNLYTEPEYVHRCQASPLSSVCVYAPPYRADDPYLYKSTERESFTEFIDEFEPLLRYFGLYRDDRRRAGSFVVSQSGYNWFGWGIDNFFELCTNQDERYTDLDNITPHHSESAVYIYRKKWTTLLIHGQPAYTGGDNKLRNAGVYLLTAGCPTQRKFINLLEQLPMTMSNGRSWEPLVLDWRNEWSGDGSRDVPSTLTEIDPRDGIAMVDSYGRQGYVCENPYYEAPDLLVDECGGAEGAHGDKSPSDSDLRKLVTDFTSTKKIFLRSSGTPATDDAEYEYERVRIGDLPKCWGFGGVTADIKVNWT